jgi:hypothetical protein
MWGYSLLLASVVFISFARDVLPDIARLREIPPRLGQVPAYVRGEIRADLAYLYQEGGTLGRERFTTPALATSMWSDVHSGARLLSAEVRADADQLGQRLSTSRAGRERGGESSARPNKVTKARREP